MGAGPFPGGPRGNLRRGTSTVTVRGRGVVCVGRGRGRRKLVGDWWEGRIDSSHLSRVRMSLFLKVKKIFKLKVKMKKNLQTLRRSHTRTGMPRGGRGTVSGGGKRGASFGGNSVSGGNSCLRGDEWVGLSESLHRTTNTPEVTKMPCSDSIVVGGGYVIHVGI